MTTTNNKRKAVEIEPSIHKGFGKLILFGEHFVVYKPVTAIVAAVDLYTTAKVEISEAEWSRGLIVEGLYIFISV